MTIFGMIRSQHILHELAQALKVRPDWHEPDEQRLSVSFGGTSFDNAMNDVSEVHVTIWQDGKPIAAVNLANLLAWASGHREPPTVDAYRVNDSYAMICPYCLTYHSHGMQEGHKVAHCINTYSPYNNGGYILHYAGDRTLAEIAKMVREVKRAVK